MLKMHTDTGDFTERLGSNSVHLIEDRFYQQGTRMIRKSFDFFSAVTVQLLSLAFTPTKDDDDACLPTSTITCFFNSFSISVCRLSN